MWLPLLWLVLWLVLELLWYTVVAANTPSIRAVSIVVSVISAPLSYQIMPRRILQSQRNTEGEKKEQKYILFCLLLLCVCREMYFYIAHSVALSFPKYTHTRSHCHFQKHTHTQNASY
jgi:peptidoglycan/LPS O-acetylase OafA/YrhL